MAALNDIVTPSLTFEEILSDGSTLTNPAADGRRLFLGEDGLFHMKDSAGTVTDVGGAGGAVATDTIWDAAGDLVVGSGANTAARLALGAAGTAPVSSGSALAYGFPDPTFRGWHLIATAITMTSGAAWTVPFASEAGGRDTNAYHDTSTNNSRCTIPSAALAGLYRVTFNVRFPGAFTGSTWIGIAKNGTWLTAGQFQISDAGANTDRQATCVAYVEMTDTQYVQAGGLFCSTTRTDLAVEFTGEWLGA